MKHDTYLIDLDGKEAQFYDEHRIYRRTLPPLKSNKIGRNAKCFCGSGRKYKHCCINSNEAP